MFRDINVYTDPLDIFNKMGERASELSDESLGFICSLIRMRKPGKILEIGVSGGDNGCHTSLPGTFRYRL